MSHFFLRCDRNHQDEEALQIGRTLFQLEGSMIRAKMKTTLSSPQAAEGVERCDMNLKCKCQWRWSVYGLCTKCHDRLHHHGCGLLSTSLYFFLSILVFAFIGTLFVWLAFSLYKRALHVGPIARCPPDNEGSWSISMYRGSSPFTLQPIEMVRSSICIFSLLLMLSISETERAK